MEGVTLGVENIWPRICSPCLLGSWGLLGGRAVVIDVSRSPQRDKVEERGPAPANQGGYWRKGRVCGDKRFLLFE